MFFHRFLTGAVAAALWAPAAWADLRVEVGGIDGPEKDNVEARLSISQYAEAGGEDEAQIRRLHRQATGDIREALQAFGYYEPVVRPTLATDEDGDWVARYEIDPGPETLVASVGIQVTGEGRELAPFQDAIKRHPVRPGRRLRHQDYEDAKSALGRAAYQNGFLDARFTEHLLLVDPLQRRADVRLVLETGPRYYFGPVSVAAEHLDPAFLARYVPIVPGAPFEPEKLNQAQFALSDLGYFNSVDVQAQKENAVERRVPIVITTTPRPPRRYDAGIGYGTDTGARLTLGAEFRRLNESGHRVRSDLRVSEVKNSIGADYRIPLGTQAADSLGFATTYTDEKISDGTSERYDFAVTLSRTPGDWQRQVYVKHQYENSFLPTTGEDTTKLLMPGLALSRGEMDDPIHARLGWALFLDVHGGTEEVVSDVTFLQGRALIRGVLPLWKNARLLGRVDLGATAIDEFRELPASQRFFAGGDQSVRGYAYQSLGPRDAAGKVIGGEFLTTYSGELEQLWGKWGVAVFTDFGNADDDPSPTLYRGAGTGLRYRAPVGTLQLDLAYPLDGDDRSLRPHLGIRVGL